MPKSRKTRKEKKLADQRQNTVSTPIKEPSRTVEKVEMADRRDTSKNITSVSTPPVSIATHNYNYLLKDLSKTLILTTVIIIAELIIKTYIA